MLIAILWALLAPYGRMHLVLGMWGMRSCPSALSSPEGFDAFYHLARHALR